MNVELITIGNEVLSGRTLDTNFAQIARALEEVNVTVAWHATVGDTLERIGEAIRHALSRADAVVVTGGLGPTPDDVTRKAVAAVLGRKLQLNEQVLESIRERARRQGRTLPASVESQALLPTGAHVLPNPVGTAPGLLLMHHDTPVFLMPGVPQEMEAILRESVVPWLRDRAGQRVATVTLRTSGVSESALQEKIGGLATHWPGATLAYLPSYFGVDLRVTAAGADAVTVERLAERARAELLDRVEAVVYAEGGRTMEDVVGEALVARGLTIAVAESCTGGLLAKRLTDTPGSSRYVERGYVTYSNAAKIELLGVSEADLERYGAVSAEVATQMARGAAERARAGVGVGVTGIAGPDGGTEAKPVGTVFIGVSDSAGVAVRRVALFGTRATIRERAAQTALDVVRRRILGLPLETKLD